MMHRGKVLDTAKGYDIIDCDICGFVHIDPVPSPEVLDTTYKEEYYTAEKPLFIARQLEDIEWWNTIYDDRYDVLERYLSPERRLLIDVGCGPGFFLKRGAERGWKGLGVEPSRQASAYARTQGLNVRNSFLHESGLGEGEERFDAAHLSEVLEHVPDPLTTCRQVFALLERGGVASFVVPNDYNPFQAVLRQTIGLQPYWVAPPHHINYFSFASLERLLTTAGFVVLEKDAMFPMESFLLMDENYVGNDELGRLCHARRKKLDMRLNASPLKAFRREMYRLMAAHGIGREMVLYARRDE
jgi:SAM-dependent methyltransferase